MLSLNDNVLYMKKLVILKSLVDILWIVSCIPLIPLTLFFAIYMFFNDDLLKIFNVIDEGIIITPWSLKVLVLMVVALILISIYSFYLFRKTLRYFQQGKPFDSFVIDTYGKIGNLLMISGIAGSILSFSFHLFFKSSIKLNFGFSPYVFVICLGLFFMILSETFKVAKTAKEENELTI